MTVWRTIVRYLHFPRKLTYIRCPECGKYGFLSERWVRSSYYPKYQSILCSRLESEERKLSKEPGNKDQQDYVNYFRESIRGNRYRGNEEKEDIDKLTVYRVISKKYYHYYIGHYDSDKFQEQMLKYRSGRLKSRPNGRKWCKLRKSSYRIEYHDSKSISHYSIKNSSQKGIKQIITI